MPNSVHNCQIGTIVRRTLSALHCLVNSTAIAFATLMTQQLSAAGNSCRQGATLCCSHGPCGVPAAHTREEDNAQVPLFLVLSALAIGGLFPASLVPRHPMFKLVAGRMASRFSHSCSCRRDGSLRPVREGAASVLGSAHETAVLLPVLANVARDGAQPMAARCRKIPITTTPW